MKNTNKKTKKVNRHASAIYRKGKKIYIRKGLIILVSLLIGVCFIGYQSTRLLNDLGAIEFYQLTLTTKKTVKPLSINPVANKEVFRPKTEYDIIGVKLNERQKKVANEIIEIAKKEDFNWIPYLIELSWCESKLGERMIGTIGNNPPSRDRGVFQINDYWHKDISDEQAFNLEWSTKWTINMINNGYQNRWSCDKTVRTNNIKIELK